MAKEKNSHIMDIELDPKDTKDITVETAIEALLNQRVKIKSLLDQLDADLESLGYKENEQQT
jgi:hypothetical protein